MRKKIDEGAFGNCKKKFLARYFRKICYEKH